MIDNNIKTELKDEVATNDKTISRDLCINRDD
jgi:hypothetical protein